MLECEDCDAVLYTALGIFAVLLSWAIVYRHGIKHSESSREAQFDRKMQDFYEDEREERREAALKDKENP